MHVVEATTIMKNDPPVGRGDVSPCLPSWIKTMCDAFQKGEGYTLSHAAVSALGHTLIGARVRAERLVQERDEAREKNWADHYFRQWQEAQEQIKQLKETSDRLLLAIDYWSHCMSEGMRLTCPEKASELADFLISCKIAPWYIPNARTDEE